MRDVEWIEGLPFHSPTDRMEDFMLAGELAMNLYYMKKDVDMGHINGEYINIACNILKRLPQNIEIDDLYVLLEETFNEK